MPVAFDAAAGDMPSNEESENYSWDDLSGEQQSQMLKYVMQGKPSTPANMSQARAMLSSDPDTVSELCKKLDIDPSTNDMDDHSDEENDNAKE